MQWWKDLSFSTRLVASFVLICTIIALLGMFALSQLATVHNTAREVQLRRLRSSRIVAAIDAELSKFRIAELQHVLSTTASQREQYETEAAHSVAKIEQHQEETLLVGLRYCEWRRLILVGRTASAKRAV